MNRTNASQRMLLLLVFLSSVGCAALRPKEAATPLRWTLDSRTPVHLGWGEVRRVQASEALQSAHLLVVRGAELMQHARFRWYARPAQMVEERLRWQGGGEAPTSTLGAATVDLWMHAFELRIDTEERASARIAMSALLRCAEETGQRRSPIALGTVEHAVAAAQNATGLADAFAEATDQALARIAERARREQHRCSPPDPDASPGRGAPPAED